MENQIKVIRSARKTLSLSVIRGEAVVRAPYFISEEQILSFVRKHSEWLKNQLQKSDPVLTFRDGETLRLFGLEYTIRRGRSGFVGNSLLLPADRRQEALVKLLKKATAEKMGALTAELAEKFGFSYSGVRVSSARGRWGSCNRNGRISYTFRIAFLPPDLCEYIAVHELCHTVIFSHGKQFWELVGKILPDYSIRNRRLKECKMVLSL